MKKQEGKGGNSLSHFMGRGLRTGSVLHIILGNQCTSYSSALKTTGVARLTDRRKKVSINFAKKAQKTAKFSTWFKPNPKTGTRTKQPQFCPAVAKTERFKKSPICELIKLLNDQ